MKRILGDFKNFLYLTWDHLRLPPPTPVQYEIADYLQHGERRQIIQAFRGVGKSWITSAYVLWGLLNNPQAKFLVVSASKQRADDFSTFTLRLINDMPILEHLKSREDQRNSKVAFDVGPALPAHAASVKSVGVFGQMTGSRATHIIADDVEVANNSQTQDMREKLLHAVLEFEAILSPGGRITFLGTPQTEESLYNTLVKRKYDRRIWPARVPSEKQLLSYNGELAESIAKRCPAEIGDPTDPKRFTHLDLMERESSFGRSGFALQFMLDTSLSDAEKYPLKLADLVVMGLNTVKAPVLVQYGSQKPLNDIPNVGFTGDRFHGPVYIDDKLASYEGSVMSIDPSGRGADETTYAVVKQLHGMLFLTRCGGFKGGYEDETLLGLARVAMQESVNHIIIEANFGDGMFLRLFQPVLLKYHKCKLEEVKHSIQKEKRIIDVLEPVMNRHKLIVDLDLVRADVRAILEGDPSYGLFYQMTRLTKERGALKHDDRIDALAIAVSYWVESMARDEHKAVQCYADRLLDEELRDFVKHCTMPPGMIAKPRTKNWMNNYRREDSAYVS